jgi:hypothetical protein
MRSRHSVTAGTRAGLLLVGTVWALPATADDKTGTAGRCPSGLQHVITSKTSGATTHRDVSRSKSWDKGTGTAMTKSTRIGWEGAYTWQVVAKTITTGGDSCSIL